MHALGPACPKTMPDYYGQDRLQYVGYSLKTNPPSNHTRHVLFAYA